MRGVDLSAATRSNVISVLHSFFAWAEAEDIIESDPSREDPPASEAETGHLPAELSMNCGRCGQQRSGTRGPPILLMEGAGLRRSEVVACRWADLDLVRGARMCSGKAATGNGCRLTPTSLAELRDLCFGALQPELDDHVFTVEVEQWVSQDERVRRQKDPKQPASARR